MEERVALEGGTFELRSAPGEGTELVATFPLSGERAAA
jgi:signal transduction histidine kinase